MIKNVLTFCLLGIFSTQVSAQVFATKSGNVEFLSKSTLETFIGKSSALNGEVNLTEKTLDFYVDLNTISTGIKLRDEHMRENHLNTEEFPFAEFTGTLIGFDATKTDTQLVVAKGDFTIRGKAKAMEIPGKLIKNGSIISIKANWEVKLADHDIPLPKFLFLKLSEVQQVSVDVMLTKE